MTKYYITVYNDNSLLNLKGLIHTWSEARRSDSSEVIVNSFRSVEGGMSNITSSGIGEWLPKGSRENYNRVTQKITYEVSEIEYNNYIRKGDF